MRPTIGRIVIYRSRTGQYDVPAIITATQESLNPAGVEVWRDTGGERGVPPLTGRDRVHLTVLSPGVPGQRVSADDFEVVSEHPIQENVGGSYQEWDVAFYDGETNPGPDPSEADLEPTPGTWRWPVHVPLSSR